MATSKSAIYEPPKRGFPYLIVTKLGKDCEVVVVKNCGIARKLVSDKVRPPSKKSAQGMTENSRT